MFLQFTFKDVMSFRDKFNVVRSEVLTEVVMKSSLFCDISACYLLHAGLLLGLFFDTEDGGDLFLRNVG
jgi:hypothetical protein